MGATDRAGLRDAGLDDKYETAAGAVYLTGTQALVRLPLMQQQRDARAGHRTAGYVSGYRGSPLGGYDQALQKASKTLDAHHVKFVPGLNEDLAATAIWGTQQAKLFPGAKYDGVFALWYGKGPGVDRCGDVFRHANQAGTAPLGGVLALAGDDVGAKSSTVAAQTDFIFHAVGMPVLAPAGVQDYLDLGLHGFAMSRFSGLWVGFKCVTDTVESGAVVKVDPDRPRIVLPEGVEMPPGGLNIRWPEEPIPKLEERLSRFKLPAALAYARANRLDRATWNTPQARLGIVSTGKAWLDTMQALADLGLDEAAARALGIAVYKVSMPWPLEPEGIRAFAEGCEEVVVVEEKRSLVEAQLKDILYPLPRRPRVLGKTGEDGRPWIPEHGELSPALVAGWLAQRIARLTGGELPARMRQRLDELEAKARPGGKTFEVINRIPYFCSGCPHNTSTRVPEGSRALAGIGCHYMAQWMGRSTDTFTHMGGEGASWVGQAPFVDTAHVFQNLGDGTYNHSGSLAIRHAVATKTNITYKILFNDAVAMTGGQLHEGQLTPQAIVRQVAAEGVARIVVVTDEPDKYPAGYFPTDVPVRHRSDLDAVQRELRDVVGVTVLVYDQTCASEKRRRRKRGTFADPAKRAFINEAVCEGCGDCSVKSNCVSIEPVETEFGRKRAINQSSCNKDFSCVEGFCPSFVTVEGGRLRRGKAAGQGTTPGGETPGGERPGGETPGGAALPALPEPQRPAIPAEGWSLLVTGIGGTGVVTIGQLLGMAAHLEGRRVSVLDMAGLAQKGGAVTSFVRFAEAGTELYAPRIGTAAADALIGCDLVVSAAADTLGRLRPGRTRAVVNAARIPTADFTANPDWRFPGNSMQAAIAAACVDDGARFVDASRLATALLGDAIATNLFMLGLAYQQGLVPVSGQAIDRAIALNAVAVEQNRAAFAWGRRAAVDMAAVEAVVAPSRAVGASAPTGAGVVAGGAGSNGPRSGPAPVDRRLSQSLDEAIARRVDFLTDYQDEAYARRYLGLVERTRAAEAASGSPASGARLSEAVARAFFKLMAYKDEYEVARLYTNGAFIQRLAEQFEGDYTLRFHLAPPLLAKRNDRGELVKRSYGPWMMKAFGLLARMRRLRGTALDPFGKTEERRAERALIDEYEATLDGLLPKLHARNLDLVVALAALPDDIRGYGHLKERAMQAAARRRAELLEKIDAAGQGAAQDRAMRVIPVARAASA